MSLGGFGQAWQLWNQMGQQGLQGQQQSPDAPLMSAVLGPMAGPIQMGRNAADSVVMAPVHAGLAALGAAGHAGGNISRALQMQKAMQMAQMAQAPGLGGPGSGTPAAPPPGPGMSPGAQRMLSGTGPNAFDQVTSREGIGANATPQAPMASPSKYDPMVDDWPPNQGQSSGKPRMVAGGAAGGMMDNDGDAGQEIAGTAEQSPLDAHQDMLIRKRRNGMGSF